MPDQAASTPRVTYLPPPPPAPPVHPVPTWVWATSVFVVLALVVGAFLVYDHGVAAARAIADPLHRHMAAEDDEAIFLESDPAFQRDVGRAKSDELFAFVRQHLGAPVSTRPVAFLRTSTPKGGEQLRLTLQTQFTLGSGTEQTTWHKVSGAYRLLGYHIDSPLIRTGDVPDNLRQPAKTPSPVTK